MKMHLSARGLFGLGFVILLATNIIVLSGVAANRSGSPSTQIRLTERVLRLPSRISGENSGLSLNLSWRVLAENTGYANYSAWQSPEWFDAEKLETLGFDVEAYTLAMDKDISYRRPLPKEVFVVLEYDGNAYQEALKRTEASWDEAKDAVSSGFPDEKQGKAVEQAAQRFQREQISNSRLFAIDVGLDPDILSVTYPDQTRFIITKGLASLKPYYNKNKKDITGTVKGLSIKNIHVSLEHRQVFDTLLDKGTRQWNSIEPPRYEVGLAYGRRWEPWIVSVEEM